MERQHAFPKPLQAATRKKVSNSARDGHADGTRSATQYNAIYIDLKNVG
jgi:hypothetical protein